MDRNEIVLGAGEVYAYEYTGDVSKLPDDAIVEDDKNNVGWCSGGFGIDYKPDKYDVINQYGKVVKSFITKETITAKTGVLTWNLKNIALLSTAKITEDAQKKTRTLTFGAGGKLKTILLRFVHEKENGKKIRFTMIGQGGNGFSLEFGEKEVVVDSEITAIEYVKNFLASFEEELTNAEAAAIGSPTNPIAASGLTITSVASATTTGSTKITVTPTLGVGNSYKYKSGTTVTNPNVGTDTATGYQTWDGTVELAIATGQKLLIVEVDATGKVIKAGQATVTSK